MGRPAQVAPGRLSDPKYPLKNTAEILTLLDAFDEILTLLGPFVPTKSVFGQITTVLDDFHEIFTRSSGTDPILSRHRFPRGRDPDFIYTQNWRGRDPDFIYTNFVYPNFIRKNAYIVKHFPAARASKSRYRFGDDVTENDDFQIRK